MDACIHSIQPSICLLHSFSMLGESLIYMCQLSPTRITQEMPNWVKPLVHQAQYPESHRWERILRGRVFKQIKLIHPHEIRTDEADQTDQTALLCLWHSTTFIFRSSATFKYGGMSSMVLPLGSNQDTILTVPHAVESYTKHTNSLGNPNIYVFLPRYYVSRSTFHLHYSS